MRHDTGPNGKALSLRDEQKRLTRRAIDGALAAFEQKGYAATTIDDIVAEANASRATFYLHFKSKADVILVMTETLGRRWRASCTSSHVRRAPVARGAVRVARRHRQNYQTNRASLEAIDHAVAIEPAVAEVDLATRQETIAVMAESIERWYGGDKEDARVRAALLLIQMDRFFDLWIIRGVPFDRERAVGALTDLWLSVLGSSAKGRARSRR